MSRKKSVVLLVIITIVLAILCVACSASFKIAGSVKDFKSVISNVSLDANFDGGYYTVLYPKGIISQEDYEVLNATDKADYTAYKGVYVSSDITLGDDFKADFSDAVKVIKKRFEAKNFAYLKIDVQDDYTIRVELDPGAEDVSSMFGYLALSGDAIFSHSSRVSRPLMKINSDYVKDVVAGYASSNGSYAVTINFTSDGRTEFNSATTTVSEDEDDNVLYVKVGDQELINVTVSEAFDTSKVTLPGFSSYATAENVAIVLSTSVDSPLELEFDIATPVEYTSKLGECVITCVLIALGAILVALFVFSLIRYKGLGLANIYSTIIFAIVTLLLINFSIAFVFTYGMLLAVLFALLLVEGGNLYVMETIRREFATGKTIASSTKTAFKKTRSLLLDVAAVMFISAIAMFFAGLTAVGAFAETLMFTSVVALLVTLFVNRFMMYLWTSVPKNKNKFKFCNFKREEEDDE